MEIKKNETVYAVEETGNKWNVKGSSGKVSWTIEVSKEQCPTENDLKKYVEKSSLF